MLGSISSTWCSRVVPLLAVGVLGGLSLAVPVALPVAAPAAAAPGSSTETLPSASIDDVTVTEGDTGTQNATFTITLDASPAVTASVRAATAPATATAPSDFTAVDTTVEFGVGETSKTVVVPIKAGTLDEYDESYTVELSEPNNLTIADGTGQGTITDNDDPPGLTISDVTVDEPESGNSSATLTLQLSRSSAKKITVRFTTRNGTATFRDYIPRTNNLVTFPAGATVRHINLGIKPDTRDEPSQTFVVNLHTPVNATITDSQGQITITDTDPTPQISVSNAALLEGESGTQTLRFTVTLTNNSDSGITVAYATANQTADAPSDYRAKSGTVSFSPGSLTRFINVVIKGDTIDEVDESFRLNLSNPTNAGIADGLGIGTILNDDVPSG